MIEMLVMMVIGAAFCPSCPREGRGHVQHTTIAKTHHPRKFRNFKQNSIHGNKRKKKFKNEL